MEKSVPGEHRLSSLGKPHEANRRFLGQILNSGEQEKRIQYLCEDGIEKSILRDHRFSSPRQAL